MSLNEFRGSQEFEEVQKLNQAIRDGIESTGIPNGMATQGGVTTQAAIDAGIAARKEAAAEREERKKSQNNYYHRKKSKKLFEEGKITEEEFNERMIKYGKKKKSIPCEGESSE